MKKILFSVAILAVAASCSKNEVTEVAPSMQSAITFSTLNDRITKAANEDDKDYKVYAVNSAATSAFYINDYVSCGSSESAQEAEGKSYYWPTDGSTLTFYAYAPYATSGTGVTDNSANGSVSLSYTVLDDANEDFTVATVPSQSSDEVQFTFAHLLSKVTVKVELETDFALAHTLDEDTYTFDLLLAENTMTVSGVTPTYGASAVTSKIAYTSAANGGYYNVLPQTMISDCAISIDNITVTNTASGIKLFDDVSLTPISLFGVTGFTKFEAGYSYEFTITVDDSATPDDNSPTLTVIKFSAKSASWETGTAATLTQG